MAKRSSIFTSGRRVQASVAGTCKPLNPLFFPFEHLLPSNYLFPDLGRIFVNDFKSLNIYLRLLCCGSLSIAVDSIGCELQLALPNARSTLNEKKVCSKN